MRCHIRDNILPSVTWLFFFLLGSLRSFISFFSVCLFYSPLQTFTLIVVLFFLSDIFNSQLFLLRRGAEINQKPMIWILNTTSKNQDVGIRWPTTALFIKITSSPVMSYRFSVPKENNTAALRGRKKAWLTWHLALPITRCNTCVGLYPRYHVTVRRSCMDSCSPPRMCLSLVLELITWYHHLQIIVSEHSEVHHGGMTSQMRQSWWE